MAKKQYYLIIDTETANGFGNPLVYDIGFAVVDRKGKVQMEGSYVVQDIFFDEWTTFNNRSLMNSAYYADKIPSYVQDIVNGRRVLADFRTIQQAVAATIKRYNIQRIGAYNMGFDKRALDTTTAFCTNSRYKSFFPKGMIFFDIWHMACQTVLNSRNYFKKAIKNGWYSENGNCYTNAENCYRHLINDNTFTESHTGLEDVKIESYIFGKCNTYSNVDKNIKPNCWQIPQDKWKLYIEKVSDDIEGHLKQQITKKF